MDTYTKNEIITTETIIKWLTKMVEDKHPIDANTWLDACQKLNVLLQGEQELLFDREQEVAKLRNIILESGDSVAKARSKIEETNEYKETRKQKAKVERIIEMIRISKLQSRMSSDIMRSN